ncbi:MAG: potassium-transporting ATPase subunit KdpA [Desulfobacterales bacterium]|nr:potassium-transporting ATPase subunit KdpA [Desulfobacterales bacterium]
MVFGGVGAGLYGMLVFVVLTVFLAGSWWDAPLNTWARRSRPYDVKVERSVHHGAGLQHPGVYGLGGGECLGSLRLEQRRPPWFLSEMLYAFSSGTGNNGSAFAGLNANTCWYNTTHRSGHAAGSLLHDRTRALALAGNLARKKRISGKAVGASRFPGSLFAVLLVRHDPDRRCAHFLPGTLAGTHCGAHAHDSGSSITVLGEGY